MPAWAGAYAPPAAVRRENDDRGSQMPLFDIEGKRAMVVGMGGIGRALALGLADHGAAVAVGDLEEERVTAVAEEVRGRGVETLAAPVEVTDERSVGEMTDRVLAEFGGIDILVNAAGVTVRTRAEDLELADWRRVLDVNATGTFVCCRVVGRHMIGHGGGRIVNLSSVRAQYGSPLGQAEYSASKGAVDALTRSLAAQWGCFGVTVNAVAPTIIETPLTSPLLGDERFARTLCESIPLGRWGQPEDVVGPVLFLASPAAGFVNGQVLLVDGGLTARI